jgi:hypothetical protein
LDRDMIIGVVKYVRAVKYQHLPGDAVAVEIFEPAVQVPKATGLNCLPAPGVRIFRWAGRT